MKYIVITSKHHDGFALFDSAVTEWDVAGATPYKKDLLAPLAEACRKHGLRLGFYYSQAQDWNHKGGAGNGWDPSQHGSMDDYIRDIAVPQVKEILTKYGEGIPAVLWWDTPAQHESRAGQAADRAAEGQARHHPQQPPGRRVQGRHRDARAAHPGHRLQGPRLGDLHDPERHLGLQVL
jgi:alpha-L-fucosidase